MEHADDDLLSNVTTFGRADGAIEQICLERNRLFGHVDMEFGPPRFKTQRRASLHTQRNRILRERLAKSSRVGLSDDHIEAVDVERVAAPDPAILIGARQRDILMAPREASRYRLVSDHPERAIERFARMWPYDTEMRRQGRYVGHSDVFSKQELVETSRERRGNV